VSGILTPQCSIEILEIARIDGGQLIMEVKVENKGNEVAMKVEGRLDTMSAPQLEEKITALGEEVADLVLDLAGLDYISSAGLRVLLGAQKKMNKQGAMKVTNVKSEVMEIFEMTGFSEILTIEN
jgi:anti-sigma B factor antagonist